MILAFTQTTQVQPLFSALFLSELLLPLLSSASSYSTGSDRQRCSFFYYSYKEQLEDRERKVPCPVDNGFVMHRCNFNDPKGRSLYCSNNANLAGNTTQFYCISKDFPFSCVFVHIFISVCFFVLKRISLENGKQLIQACFKAFYDSFA